MINEEMKKERLKRIGCSDLPALFGLGWGEDALANLVARRIYNMVDEPETERGSPADVGNFQELALVPFMARALDVSMDRVVRDPYVIHSEGLLAANLDGWIQPSDHNWPSGELAPPAQTGLWAGPELPAGGITLQAKSTGKFKQWGDAADQVPDSVIFQVTGEMACARTKESMVGVTLAGFNRIVMQTHMVYLSDGILNQVMERVEWITGYIKRGEMPPDTMPGLPTLRAIIPRKKRTTIEAQVVIRWEELRERRLDLEKKEEEAQRLVLTAMPDHEIADYGDDERELAATLIKPRITLGTSHEHSTARCEHCGVGKKVGRPTRSLRTRKRKE